MSTHTLTSDLRPLADLKRYVPTYATNNLLGWKMWMGQTPLRPLIRPACQVQMPWNYFKHAGLVHLFCIN